MNNEKQKILDMLEKGTITPADAAKLLEGMKAQGIDLRQLNLGAIVDVFEELEEDIVNVRVKDAHNDLLVRVYVE